MLQIDATPYEWFEDGQSCALHGAIDDATGIITGLYMTKNECLQGYFEVMRHTILEFGGSIVGILGQTHHIPFTANGKERRNRRRSKFDTVRARVSGVWNKYNPRAFATSQRAHRTSMGDASKQTAN